jgi:hypothetical protein
MRQKLPDLTTLEGPRLKVPVLGELKVSATIVTGTKADADPENVADAHTGRLDELALVTTNVQPPPAGENDDEEDVPSTIPDPVADTRLGPRADRLNQEDLMRTPGVADPENDDEEPVPATLPAPDTEPRVGPRPDPLSDDDTVGVPITGPRRPVPLR